MLALYASSESLYCAKLRVLLRHKNLQWQEISPEGGCGSDAYRDLISTGTTPAIIDEDFVLTDSEAIAEYLNETHPTPAMLPVDFKARARCRERSRFHDTRLEPAVRALFPYIGKLNPVELVNQHSQLLNQRFVEMNRVIEADDTLDSSRLTLADCGFPISFAWIDAFVPIMGLQLKWPNSILEYRLEIEQHEAVSQELKAYRAGMQEWLDSKNV